MKNLNDHAILYFVEMKNYLLDVAIFGRLKNK